MPECSERKLVETLKQLGDKSQGRDVEPFIDVQAYPSSIITAERNSRKGGETFGGKGSVTDLTQFDDGEMELMDQNRRDDLGNATFTIKYQPHLQDDVNSAFGASGGIKTKTKAIDLTKATNHSKQ